MEDNKAEGIAEGHIEDLLGLVRDHNPLEEAHCNGIQGEGAEPRTIRVARSAMRVADSDH